MKRMRLLPLSAVIALALAGPAHDESLLDLYIAARANDATWQSAKNQYDANLARADQSLAGILPQAGLSGSVNRNAFNLDLGNVDRKYTTHAITLSASQPLYRPANLATYRQGKRQA